jgi:hypothetical protein
VTGDILDLIDSALDDCSASDDAMRWAPDPARVICDGGRPLQPERWSPWRHGNWSYKVTAVGADGAAAEGVTVDIGAAEITTSSEWYVISRDSSGAPCGLRSLDRGGYVIGPRELSATYTFRIGPASPLMHYAHALRLRGWYRCPTCHPRGNPGQLAVDGREYARRRKARKKRR